MIGLLISISHTAMPLAFTLFVIRVFYFCTTPIVSLVLRVIISCVLFVIILLSEILKRRGISLRMIEAYRSWYGKYINENFRENLSKVINGMMKISGNRYFSVFLSFIIVYVYYSSVSFENFFSPFSFLNTSAIFLNYTALALSHGYAIANYPHVKIHSRNGIEVVGRALKFGEFISILRENERKIVLINENSIFSIEKSLYDDNGGVRCFV